ncbi:MAG TPA: YciI family protein [Dinghuibacter sp.]|jgi:uncharacterized protein YciI|uniref:YciI family protein n=1 Tax=Dinghuibacter sp. TaxID=2024697 RepID=UPI002BFE2915|nr:YciI family protein [Dinghuibacter sp.]HTJ11918.1 YciI family protein [Dinghuibacter sp.]
MIRLCLLLAATTAITAATAQTYDSTLAKQWKADAYGMRLYTLVMLRTGPALKGTKAHEDSLQMAHLNNIKRLADEGKLVLAGPLGKNDHQYEGIFILATSKIDEAKAWVESDPAVQAHELEPEYLRWYASASVMGIPDAHKKVQKESF